MWRGLTLIVVAFGSFGAFPLESPAESSGELKRGAFFGARVNALSEETRERLKLDVGTGAEIGEVFRGSSAEAAGFKPGDVVLAVDGTKISGAGELVRAISARKGGDSLTIEFRRGDAARKEKLTLKPRPLETSEAYEVIYGSVPARAGRLRTIVTAPKAGGKHPALFVIQGVGLFSVDNPVGPISSYRTIVDAFSRHGYATLRVDKPGCGDSEGGPAREVDFDTELDGYRQGLKMLKSRSDVDASRVFVLGHSMGGVMAPLLATEISVRGIIVYGTISRTWTEYMLENTRRQLALADADPSAIDRQLREEAALLTYLYGEKLPPKEIAARHPGLRERLAQTITDDRYFVDRSLTFFQQLADKNLGAAWEPFQGDVLAIWGKADFVSNEDDHALIARIVNRDHPGHGTFLAMDGIDHGFNRAASQRESFGRGRSGEAGEFNPAILETCRSWIEKIAGTRPQ
jgi:pimeloyl-ACP methyl ester carboxylesterase